MADTTGDDQLEFKLVTTTRFDPFLSSLRWNNDADGPSSFYLLPYHHDRLLAAAKQHGWQLPANLKYEDLKMGCQHTVSDPSTAYRIRVALSLTGVLDISSSPISPFEVDPTSVSFYNPINDDVPKLYGPLINVYIDSEATLPSIFTTTKTTNRAHYEKARSRNNIEPLSTPAGRASDVLLYTPENLIMETTIFNVAFYRSSRWVTPTTSTGCLPGVLRRWLIQEDRIREDENGVLTKESIKPGDFLLLFNGVQGCRLGRII